jgi:predicted TIM-barrel fold metal-dependent hydrolase
VDVALLLSEYSPKVTGIQAIEDIVPLAQRNPSRIKLIANINPHYHYPVDEELRRQLDLGAVALKLHPVHAGMAANDRSLYPAYEVCQAAGIPLVVHCGTSTFPGSMPTSTPTRSCSTTCCATSAA